METSAEGSLALGIAFSDSLHEPVLKAVCERRRREGV